MLQLKSETKTRLSVPLKAKLKKLQRRRKNLDKDIDGLEREIEKQKYHDSDIQRKKKNYKRLSGQAKESALFNDKKRKRIDRINKLNEWLRSAVKLTAVMATDYDPNDWGPTRKELVKAIEKIIKLSANIDKASVSEFEDEEVAIGRKQIIRWKASATEIGGWFAVTATANAFVNEEGPKWRAFVFNKKGVLGSELFNTSTAAKDFSEKLMVRGAHKTKASVSEFEDEEVAFFEDDFLPDGDNMVVIGVSKKMDVFRKKYPISTEAESERSVASFLKKMGGVRNIHTAFVAPEDDLSDITVLNHKRARARKMLRQKRSGGVKGRKTLRNKPDDEWDDEEASVSEFEDQETAAIMIGRGIEFPAKDKEIRQALNELLVASRMAFKPVPKAINANFYKENPDAWESMCDAMGGTFGKIVDGSIGKKKYVKWAKDTGFAGFIKACKVNKKQSIKKWQKELSAFVNEIKTSTSFLPYILNQFYELLDDDTLHWSEFMHNIAVDLEPSNEPGGWRLMNLWGALICNGSDRGWDVWEKAYNKFHALYESLEEYASASEFEDTELAAKQCKFRYADGRAKQCESDAKDGGYCKDHDTKAKRRKNDINP